MFINLLLFSVILLWKFVNLLDFFFVEVAGFLLMKLLWGRSKKKEKGIRGWWEKKKEKGEDVQQKHREEENGKWRYFEGCEKKKRILEEIIKNKYLNEIELRIEN